MRQRKDYSYRSWLIIFAMTVVFMIYIGRLFFLQIISTDYSAAANNNALLHKRIHASRGAIYDRNGKLIVSNRPTYDLTVIFKETTAFDTAAFCALIDTTPEELRQRIAQVKDRRHNPGYSYVQPQTLIGQLSLQESGRLQEMLYKYPGFYLESRSIRQYNYPNAGLMLGYTGEVDRNDMKNDPYYTMGDYSGRSGIEKSYEKALRGTKGEEIFLRDARGNIKGSYKQGKYNIPPIAGNDIHLAIDIELQALGEKILKDHTGSIVMIEPATGEILALVSSPSYDPALMVGRHRGKHLSELSKDPNKPLFNRPLMAAYPPGSTFKAAQGLVFLQEGVINTTTYFPCIGGYAPLGNKPRCHAHPSPVDIVGAMATSCNAYFCYGLNRMLSKGNFYPTIQVATDKWRDYMVSMGFGWPLKVDVPNEKRGFIPNSAYYDKAFGYKHWRPSSIISISIGQGEILTTPLQICNLASQIANRGYFYTPHVVAAIEGAEIDSLYHQRHKTMIEQQHYNSIIRGMRMAVTGGSCRGAAIPGIEVCGKTGTAENRHGKDHSIFMGFAPMDNPRVAIAVYVENAGFGAQVAVPAAQKMLTLYLTGKLPDPVLPKVKEKIKKPDPNEAEQTDEGSASLNEKKKRALLSPPPMAIPSLERPSIESSPPLTLPNL